MIFDIPSNIFHIALAHFGAKGLAIINSIKHNSIIAMVPVIFYFTEEKMRVKDFNSLAEGIPSLFSLFVTELKLTYNYC